MTAVQEKAGVLPREPVDADDLHELLLHAMQQHRARAETHNIDETYPPFSHGMAAAALVGRGEDYRRYLSDHRQQLFEVYGLWSDHGSRDLFVKLMLFRALGHAHVRLPTSVPSFWRAHAHARALASTPSPMRHVPGGEALQHFSLTWQGRRLELDCLRANMLFSFFLRQYHLDRGEIHVGPRWGDHVIDVGACFGDTAIDFAIDAGPEGCVHCFDVVDTHLQVLRCNAAQNPEGAPIVIHERGLSDVDQQGSIVHSGVRPGYSVAGDSQVPLSRLDSLVDTGRIERVDFIKMDIEGHEEAALRGGAAALRRFRPRLAISMYHRWDDYHRLPLLVRDLGLGYRFFLDNYTISDGETIMYCVA